MENFNYNSLDYLTVTRKLLDDTVWTTIKDRFVGDSGSGDGVIAHGSEWFSGLFDAGSYKIDGTNTSFHNPRFVKFLDNYTDILIKPFEEAIKLDKQVIVQMSLHPRTSNCDWIETNYFKPLFEKYKNLLDKMRNGEAHLLLFFGWEADNFSEDNTSFPKKGKYTSYYSMFDAVRTSYDLPSESIIILNSNLMGYAQEKRNYGEDLNHGEYTQVIYESAFELNTFKSQKGKWNPEYTFDEHISNLKNNDIKKMLRINRTQLGCRDMMLYWLEKTGYVKDTIVEHRAKEKFNDSYFKKELNTWLKQDDEPEYDYYAVKYYLDECKKMAERLDFTNLSSGFDFNENIIKQIENNSPYIASKDELLGSFSDIYSNEYIPMDCYQRTIFSWVSTSLTDRFDQVFINASTFQPMLNYHPIIFNSNREHNYYMKLSGFKDYSWFSEVETVDMCPTQYERMVLNTNEIDKLMKKSKDELINLIIDNRESLEHNRKLLFECKSIENIIKKLFVIINKKFIDSTGTFKELL